VGDDVVEEKTCYSFSGVFEGGYSFSPFSEIIDCHDDVFVSIARWQVANHEVYAPFAKGARSNDWVEKSRWCSRFFGI
jgi:hypothetical protein